MFVNVPERQPVNLTQPSRGLRVDQPLRGPLICLARTHNLPFCTRTHAHATHTHKHTLHSFTAVAITQKTSASLFQEHFSSSQKRHSPWGHRSRDVLMHHHLCGGHGSGHQPVLQKHEADVLWFSSTAEGGELDAEGVVALCFMRWSLLTMINTHELLSCAF